MIYFIQSPEGGPIKIGTTIRLSERLKQLCKEHGQELRVLAIADGNYDAEKVLHRRFRRLRLLNEWFEPGDDLLGFIVSDGKPWDGSDDAPPVCRTGMRTTVGWAEWLERAAKFCRTDVAKLIDASVADYVKARGFNDPPPERIP